MLDEAQAGRATCARIRPSALGLLMGAGGPRRPRQADAASLPPALEPFGLWVEQLVAESTGKQGVGVVPICRRDARRCRTSTATIALFVRLRTSGDPDDDRATGQSQDSAREPIATIDFPGAGRARRRVRPLGNRHRHRRRAARDQSVRRAERAAGEGRDARAARCATRPTVTCRRRAPETTTRRRDADA